MKMTKKALTAMIAASIAATALPAAAMVSNLTNTLTSSNSDGANNTSPQTTPAAAPETSAQTAAPAVQAEPSAKSMFITEDVEGGVAITGFKTDDANFTSKVVIPLTINDKTVVSLKNNNYQNCMDGADQVASLDTSLCNSLSIEDLAFRGCTSITSVNLSGCTSIGTSAFQNCTGISGSVDLSSCTIVGESAFVNCCGITDVTWPTNNMPTIPVGCFSSCTSLKTFNSKTDFNLSGITSIGDYAFSGCSGITGSVNLSSCTSIGDHAFNGCINITGSVDLSSCTSVGNNAFQNCKSITGSIDLSSCTIVGESAFTNCSGITDVTWPTNNMPTIPVGCFSGCASLKTFNSKTDFNLSDITSVGNYAFNGCTGVTGSVDLSSCTSVGEYAFSGCTGINSSVNLSGCNFIKRGAFASCTGISSIIFPTEHSYTIEDYAFNRCTGVTGSVDLSNCISVGSYAFYSCSGITGSVDLSSCTSIGDFAFSACTGITGSVDLSSCTSVGNSAFRECTGITDVTWPTNNMSTIPEYCFAYCTSLKTFNNDTDFNLSDITSVGNSAFRKCTGITSITFPTEHSYTTYTIGENAFYECTSITGSVDLSGCNSIKSGAFVDCANISSITFPTEHSYTIGAYAFSGCSSITDSVNLSNCTTIGNYAFSGCPNLKPTISTKATTVGSNAFSYSSYVTIQAADEAKLASYCSGITSSGDLIGLSSVKKLASIPGVTNQIPAGLSYDLAGNIPDNNAAYYLTASQNSDYTAKDGYIAANVYDIALKGAKNGESAVSAMSGTIPISITTDEYHSATSYYLDVDGTLDTNAIAPTQNDDGTYTFTQNVALGESGSTVALVYRNIQVSTITVTGDDTVPYSENGTVEFSAKITPDNALNPNVTWSSDNENVLKFSDPNSGTATIVGAGTANVIATATDGSNVTGSKKVSVTPAQGAGYTIDYANEKISAIDDGYEVSNTSDFASLLNVEDIVAPGETLYVRTVGATAYTENKLPERPTTPGKPKITQTASTLTATGGAEGQEYKFDKAVNTSRASTLGQWQDSPAFTDSTMAAGDTYTVTTRVKATDSSFASEEISSTYQVQNTPAANGVRLDGKSTGIEWENITNTSDTKKYGADTPYEIPLYLQTKGGDTYMVGIDWGNMLFSYNFGTWDTETLSYDDPSKQGWTTSFDGVNNQVTVINRSSNAIESTIGLTVDADKQAELEHLGFHLTSDNKNSEDLNDYYPTKAKTLQRGPTGNSTTAYVNIKSDDTKPNDSILEKYSQEVDGTQIGNITVTVQKTTNNP